MKLGEDEARRRFSSSREARLATLGERGRPHKVPVTFAVVGGTIWSAVDEVKPKTTPRLRRLANVSAHPAVSFLADRYDEDWSRLWWVRANGTGRVVLSLDDVPEAREALCARYPQYAAWPPAGPALAVDVARWVGWAGS
ncbi:MAG: TIGR03668 family PPOX class F420-dependent oxidoreductase [Acidimicrobiales bacterium]